MLSYLLGLASALLVGFSKTGLPGVSIPGIVLMTEAFPDDAKLSLGAILPVLLVGDVFAVCWYRHHAQWNRLFGLFPYVLAGMVPGVVLLRCVEGNELRPVLGWLILGLLVVEVCRRARDRATGSTGALGPRPASVLPPVASRRAPPCPLGPTCSCGQCGAVPSVEDGNGTSLAVLTAACRVREAVSAGESTGGRRSESVFEQTGTVPFPLSGGNTADGATIGLLPRPAACAPLPALPALPAAAHGPCPTNPVAPSHASQSSPRFLSASWCFMAAMGFLAGLSTVVANAAMPVMTIYLLSRRLHKQQFMGTAAWFFFLVNLSKLPVCYWLLHVMTPRTITFGLVVAPMTIVGGLVGVYVLARIPQRFFDALALSLAGIAAVRLIVA